MELLLTILASLVIALSPQSSIEPLTYTEIGVVQEYTDDFGDVGSFEEETIDSEVLEAFGFNPVEDAWSAFEYLQVPLASSETLMAYEYVATYKGSVPEFDAAYFSITSPTHFDVKHVFKATALTAA